MKNLSYEQRKQALIQEITVAFDGVSREGGVSLSEAWVIDDYGSAEERAEARSQDIESRWQDVPDEDIAHGYSCLSFLDPIGFRYYIPAYIVWYLRNIDNEDPDSPFFSSNTFEYLIYALTLENSGNWEAYYLNKYSLFTPSESKAIAHFLEFDATREDAVNIECEQWRQKSLAKDGFSQKEINDAKEDGKRISLEYDLPDNFARRALERHWGQFL